MAFIHRPSADSFNRKARPPAPGGEAARKTEIAEACAALIDACQDADVEAIKDVLDSHIRLVPQIINAKDDNGWTPLHICVGWCALECVSVLLTRGADPDIRNGQGQAPRDLAVQLGYEKIAGSLIAVPGARDAALRQAQAAEMKADIDIITRGLPDNTNIPCITLNLKPHIRRSH